MSPITYRIAQLEDVEAVYQFEIKKNFSNDSESFENKMAVWDSHYRTEALNHYFKTGWSFIAHDSEKNVVGFFIGQALLFLEKQTQSLWVEYISAINSEIKTELVDIAYRLAREKHFQRVLFAKSLEQAQLTKSFPFQNWERENIF